MAGMDAGSVDAVLADPPYNVGKQYGDYADDLPTDEYLSWLRAVYLEASRVSRVTLQSGST
jgi:site-specific DNA-methyltransferase (adenine-specific)